MLETFLYNIRRNRRLQGVISCIVLFFIFIGYRRSSSESAPSTYRTIDENGNTYTRSTPPADAGEPVRQVSIMTHSLETPYTNDQLINKWFDFGGDTMAVNGKHLRLTADRAAQSGFIYSRLPFTASSFVIDLEFKISGKPTSLYGDGMALWLTENRQKRGHVFGLEDNFKGLGIFVDTYRNGKAGTTFPYIMAMLGDGQTKYDKWQDGKTNELGGCSARGLYNSHENAHLKITYIKDGFLSVAIKYKPGQGYKNCFTLNDIQLPVIRYLGLSAETGELSENVDIIKLNSYFLYNQEGKPIESSENIESWLPDEDEDQTSNQNNNQENTKRQNRNALREKKKQQARLYNKKYDNEGGGWLWFFFKFILIIAVLFGFYVAVVYFRVQKKQRSDASRYDYGELGF